MTEYAPLGLIGVLTPQANTTVEPEFSILCPPGVTLLTARLTSEKASMDNRLVDYVLSMEGSLNRFANAPLGAVIFACTGAAYLVDPEKENETLAARLTADGRKDTTTLGWRATSTWCGPSSGSM